MFIFFVNYILPFRLWEEIKQSRNMVLFVEKIPKTYKTYQIYSFPKLSVVFFPNTCRQQESVDIYK